MSTNAIIAFAGTTCIANGDLPRVAQTTRLYLDEHPHDQVLVFDAETSEAVELDLRGSVDDVLSRLQLSEPARRPGRPKLGVVAKEVTLLPRHWEWLASQPGGASVTLRKLVEAARKADGSKQQVRRAQDAAYKFMFAVGGNLPHFEEVTRALYASDRERFEALTAEWPHDVRDHAREVAADAFVEASQ